jgi:hypothetical protein
MLDLEETTWSDAKIRANQCCFSTGSDPVRAYAVDAELLLARLGFIERRLRVCVNRCNLSETGSLRILAAHEHTGTDSH